MFIYTLTDQQKNKITAAWLQRLTPIGYIPSNEQVLKVLNEILDMSHPQVTLPVTQQEVGNCSYANRLGLYKGLHLLKSFELLNKSLITDIAADEFTKLLKNSTKKSNNVITFIRTQVIHELVKQAKKYNIQEENLQVTLPKQTMDYREIYTDITRNIIYTLQPKWPKRKLKKIEQDLNRIEMMLENLGPKRRNQALLGLNFRGSLAPVLIPQALKFNKEKLAFLMVDCDPDFKRYLPLELRDKYQEYVLKKELSAPGPKAGPSI